jgi:outer membrane protein assembly factor BamB
MTRRWQWVIAVFLCALAVSAADWPQWRGPHRDDISADTGLLKHWPKGGPPLRWTYTNAGVGYSGPAIVGDRLYIMGGRGNTEFVIALSVSTGKQVWSTPIGECFRNPYGDGPRGTPTIDGQFLYALGGQGELVCLDTTSGRKVWHINLKKDLGGQMMSGWGYTESPVVDGDRLICTPGGNRGTVACLDKMTGKVQWRSTELKDPACYSSLTVDELNGVRQFVVTTAKGVAGLAVDGGRLLWRYNRPEFATAVIPTAIERDNYVYSVAGYTAGCDLIKITRDSQGFTPQKVYHLKDMDNKHGGVVLVGDYLYGYTDHERGAWACQELRTGKIQWREERKLGKGSLTFADGHLYCYTERDGTVGLVEATPEGFKEDGRLSIPRETTLRKQKGGIWTHPVVANGRLFLRDQDLVFCYDLKSAIAKK